MRGVLDLVFLVGGVSDWQGNARQGDESELSKA